MKAGDIIKAARALKGIDQRELAGIPGVSQQAVSHWERRKRWGISGEAQPFGTLGSEARILSSRKQISYLHNAWCK